MKYVRFFVSGSTAAAVDLIALYVLFDLLGMNHVYATAVAFIIAFFVSFFLQKYWTFADRATGNIKKQMSIFLCFTVFNFFLNTWLVHIGVAYLNLHPVVSQIIVGLLIAIISFVFYSKFVFKNQSNQLVDGKKSMKLLVITQKLNKEDPILGFFNEWLVEIAKKIEKLTVVSLEAKQKHDLPNTVTVLSLGKGENNSRLKYIFNFLKIIFTRSNEYDYVLVHMNPIYIVLGGMFWRLMDKKIFLWYTHKHVNLMLRVAVFFAHKVFSASKESFRLKTDKINIMGHGILTSYFAPVLNKDLGEGLEKPFRVITTGRISPVKNYKLMIEAVSLLYAKYKLNVNLEILGAAQSDDQIKHLEDLKVLSNSLDVSDKVKFVSAVPNKEVVKFLQHSDAFLNLSETGSLDKAVLEAMSVGLLVVTSNEAFKDMLNMVDGNLFVKNEASSVAESLSYVAGMTLDKRLELSKKSREIIVREHNLTALIDKLVKSMAE